MGLTSSYDIPIELNFQPKQRLILEAPSSFILAGGAAGGGKSWVIRAMAYIYSISMPGLQTYIIRRELKSLVQSYLAGDGGFPVMLQPLVDAKLCKINYSTNTISFKNGGAKRNRWAGGSVIRLIHLSSQAAIESITGAELGLALIDESSSLPEEYIQHIITRVRLGSWRPPEDSPYKHCVPKIVGATNPSGVSRLWWKKKFVDVLEPYKLTKVEGESLPLLFVPSLAIDNDALMQSDPGYIERLRSMDDEVKRQMYLYGNWNVDLDALFTNSFKESENKLPQFKLPAGQKVYRNFDWGSSAPFAVIYNIVCDGTAIEIEDKKYYFPKGTIIIVDEIFGGDPHNLEKGLGISDIQIGEHIRKYELEHLNHVNVLPGAGDGAIYTRDNNKHCQVEDINRGFYGREMYDINCLFKPFYKPAGSRIEGYSKMRSMFVAGHGWKNQSLTSPALFVTSNCRYWLQQVPNLPRDPKNIDDCSKGTRDEFADVTRYIVLTNSPQVRTITASVY